MPHVHCKTCDKEFYIKPYHFKKGWGKFCSNPCQNSAKRTGKTLPCNNCGKKLYRSKRELKRSRSGKFFCNRSCFAVWKNTTLFSGENHANWKHGKSAYRKMMLQSGKEVICERCGLKDERVLIVHHIDHNRRNNGLDNLMWLCRNCHYLEHEGKTV